jgi:hypothetical protein
MRRVILALGIAAAGCGGATPVSPSLSNPPASAAAVASTVGGDPASGQTITMTLPCQNGGSIVSTSTRPPLVVQDFTITFPPTTTRVELNDCRNGDVVMHGDPYLLTTSEYGLPASPSVGSWPTMTMKMTGAIRFESGGSQGRAQYDCTRVMTLQSDGGTPVFTTTSTGTIVWEQPIGAAPVTRSCGL